MMATKKITSFDATPLLEIIDAPGKRQALWERLCEAIDAPATLRAAPLWLPEVTSHLDATWHDSERVWPLKWLTRKAPHPAASIARTLWLRDITPAQQKRVMAHLAQLDATNMPPLTRFEATGIGSRRAEVSAADAAVVWGALAYARLRWVMINNDVGELDALVERMGGEPALREVEALILDYMGEAALRSLAASPYSGALRRLTLRSQRPLTVEAAEALCGLSGRLEHLQLSILYMGGQRARGEAWAALWAAPWTALRELSLSLRLPPDALPALLAATPALERLSVGSATLDGAPPQASHAALRTLSLASIAVSDEALAALLGCLPGLRELSLSFEAALGPQTAEALGRMEGLKRLVLDNEVAGEEAWAALEAGGLAGVEVLEVSARALGARGELRVLEALGRAELPALKVLDLSYIEMTDAQIEAVAALRLPDGAALGYGPHSSSYYAETARKLDARLGRAT